MKGSRSFSPVKALCWLQECERIFLNGQDPWKNRGMKLPRHRSTEAMQRLVESGEAARHCQLVTALSSSVETEPWPGFRCLQPLLNVVHILKLHPKQTWNSSLIRIWSWLKCNEQAVRILVAKNLSWKQELCLTCNTLCAENNSWLDD